MHFATMQMRMRRNDYSRALPPRRAIERDAAALLAEYRAGARRRVKPPIPIEDIVEKHLKLGIEFDDMHRLFGIPRSGSVWIPISSARSSSTTPDRDRREPRSRGAPGEGRPLSFHARPRGRRALATAPSSVRQGPGAGSLVRRAGGSRPLSADRAKPRNGWSGRRISTLRAC